MTAPTLRPVPCRSCGLNVGQAAVDGSAAIAFRGGRRQNLGPLGSMENAARHVLSAHHNWGQCKGKRS